MNCLPQHIIHSSDLVGKVRYKDGDTPDIIRVIMDMDAISDRFINQKKVKCIEGDTRYDTLHNVWKFVKYNVRYKTDRPGKEVVKSPAALFTMGVGDCKSFSIAEAAILRSLGFTGIRYRFASYKRDQIVTHVYIVCKYRGKDVILDAVHTHFDEEVPYTYKMDIPAQKVAAMAGIGAAGAVKVSPQKILGLGLIALALLR